VGFIGVEREIGENGLKV